MNKLIKNNNKETKNQFDKFDYHCEVLNISRTTKVVLNKKKTNYKVILIIGNFNNKIGLGIAKSFSLDSALKHAIKIAFKNLKYIPPIKFAKLDIKFKKTKAIVTYNKFFGLKMNKISYIIFKLIGLENISIKLFGPKSNLIVIYLSFKILNRLIEINKNYC